ncbi:sulfotransferase domain-containing protein [Aurantiacibacter spongiae]|uniref:Sulfotransferase n=1 Tax=Aurantiacibacter spongiae TaxID=2488860 RepID=A0A3N5CS36_9SPHN|nr:sulfotransferase domain-containing protein [Aurantiacibacter spongiae]RPF71166.1 sulfotransferase [Aurantiacibacter spongiae]
MKRAVVQLIKSARRRYVHEPHLRAAAREVDAFLVSYPKSGRTWLRFLLSCYFAETAGLGFAPDLTTTFRVLPNFDRDPVRGLTAFVGPRPGLPLIAVSHLPYRERLFADAPVIFLVRDPRDVIVSAYFHATRHKHTFEGPIDGFLDDSQYGLPALIAYLNGWAEGLAGRRSLTVTYERMQDDPHAEISRIIRFLGHEVDEGALTRAIDAAAFDRMQKTERKSGIPGHDYDRSDRNSLRMRKGRAHAFADTLSDGQADVVLARCEAELTRDARDLLAQSLRQPAEA